MLKYYNHNLYNYTINLLNMFYDLYDIYILIIYYSKYTGSKIDKFRQISTKIIVLSADYLLVINSIKLLIFSQYTSFLKKYD